MFGTYGKLDQTEIALHVDCKKPLLTRKTILVLILPSIVLHFSHNPHTLPTHTLQAQLWPLTNERETESSTLSLTPVRAPSTIRQARQSTHLCASEFPPLFEFYLSLTTSPHLRSTHLRPVVTLPHASKAIPASNIFNPSLAKPSSQTHPQSLTLSSSSHQVYHVYVVNKCFCFDFWLC